MPRPRYATSPESRAAQSAYAIAVREHGAAHPTTAALRARFAAERHLATVASALADPPPLDPSARARLGTLLERALNASGCDRAGSPA